jgi:hypothetical protein
MGTPIIGRNCFVNVNGTKILNLASWDLSFDTDDIDASVFGTGWGSTMPGMQKWVANVAGFYDPADTTGQKVLESAKINATKLTNIEFCFSSVSYWRPNMTVDSDAGAYIGTMAIKVDKSGIAAVSFKVGGVGPIHYVG